MTPSLPIERMIIWTDAATTLEIRELTRKLIWNNHDKETGGVEC